MRGSRHLRDGNLWLHRQLTDPFVRAAQRDGYVCRSAYKLLAIDDRFKLFSRRTRTVVDLGSAPGSWCQVIRQRVGDGCTVVAVDLLPVHTAAVGPSALFLQGDFTSLELQRRLRKALAEGHDGRRPGADPNETMTPPQRTTRAVSGRDSAREGGIKLSLVDVVTSDMRPNRQGGGGAGDIAAQALLNEKALEFALHHLKPGGHFVCKVLGSEKNFADLAETARRWFAEVFPGFRPPAVRSESAESFLVATVRRTEPSSSRSQNSFGLDDWPGLKRTDDYVLSRNRRSRRF